MTQSLLLAGAPLAAAYLELLRAATFALVCKPEFARGVDVLVPPLLKHRTLSKRAVKEIFDQANVRPLKEEK